MRITPDEAIKRLSKSQQTYAKLFQHGSLLIEIYQPRKVDLQEPHDQDELYLIISGSGTFVRSTKKISFAAGDLLFAPAGQAHYFENFTDDFRTWVIFYGPKGGEHSTGASHR